MNKANHDLIATLYLSGLSGRSVAKQMGISAQTVFTCIQERNISRNRSQSQLMGCLKNVAISQEQTFSIMTAEKAWFLGLIFGDGSISKQGYSFTFTSGDKDIICSVNNILGGGSKVFDYSTYQTISFNSKRLVNELMEIYGLTPNKSKTMKMPFLGDENLVSHFHRGLLDSDGCFSFDTRCSKKKLIYTYVTMSLDFAEAMVEDFRSFCHVSKGRSIGKTGKGAYQIRYSNQDAISIAEWIYNDSSATNRGKRKFETYKTAM